MGRHRSWSRTRLRSRSGRSRRRSISRRSRSRRSSSRVGHDAAVEEARLLLESDIIRFCDQHKLDLQASSCQTCKLVTRSVGKAVLPELLKLKGAKDSASESIPSTAERYASRLDDRPPTLTFTESDLALAVLLFSCGRMLPPTLFDDLTKEYLMLPLGQNKTLTKSVQLEKFLFKYKRDKFFADIYFINWSRCR